MATQTDVFPHVESYPNTWPHRLMCSHNVKDMFFYSGAEVVKFDVFLYTNCVRVCEDVCMSVCVWGGGERDREINKILM